MVSSVADLLQHLISAWLKNYFLVPPRWQIEPTDANVSAGQDVVLNCQATGYPTPTVVWKKSIGGQVFIS